MGVRTCSRNGCTNIMCDTCVPEGGNICESCKTEFKGYMSTRLQFNNNLKYSESLITDFVVSFMETEKYESPEWDNDKIINEYFEKYTS